MHKTFIIGISAGLLAFTALNASGAAVSAPDRLVLAEAGANPPAQVQNRGPRGPRGGPAKFSDFDLDGDGKMTEQEFNEGRARRMAERAQQGGQMRNAASAPAFAQVDADGDGTITPGEFAAHQAERRGGQ